MCDTPAIGLDDPLRLKDAIRIAFPAGGMTVSGLLREARRGRLIIERIAGKYFTTLRNIEAMRQKCRANPVEPVSGSNQQSTPQAVRSVGKQGGSSATDRVSSARAALEKTARGLSASSPSTSSASIKSQGTAVVIPLKS
jgi:hypothetical protein